MPAEHYIKRKILEFALDICKEFNSIKPGIYEVLKIPHMNEIDVIKSFSIFGMKFGTSSVRIVYDGDLKIMTNKNAVPVVKKVVDKYEHFGDKDINVFKAMSLRYELIEI